MKRLKLIGNLIFILLLFAILFSYAMFQGGFVSWFLFYGFLPILIYQFGLLLYPIHSWKVTRRMSPSAVSSGGSITCQIEIERKFGFPIYYCVVEELMPKTLNQIDIKQEKYYHMENPKPLMVERSIKKMLFPVFKRNITFQYKIGQVPRGEHTFKAIRIRVGDMVGFVKKEYVYETEDKLIVYPSELPIRLGKKIHSFAQGAVASSPLRQANTTIATGVREYEPGDRFSWIDWKQTARKNTVMTKEFEQEKSTNFIVVLDSCYYPGINRIAYEATIELTVSLLENINRQGYPSNFLSIHGKGVNGSLQIDNGFGSKNRIQQHLTNLQIEEQEASFATLLEEQMIRMQNGDRIIILTTNIDEVFKQTVIRLKKRIKGITVILVRAKSHISSTEEEWIQQFRYTDIGIHVVTEEKLVNGPIEVSL